MVEKKVKPVIWAISYFYPPNFTGAGIQVLLENQKMIQGGMLVNVLTAGDSVAKHLRGKQVNMDGIIVNYLSIIPTPSWSFFSRFQFLYKLLFYISSLLTSISFALGCAWVLLHDGRRNDIVTFESTDTFSIIPVAITRLKGMHSVIRMSLFGSDDPYAILTRARRGQILEYLNLASFHAAEGIVAICTAMLESCQKAKIANRKLIYIPHGVDINLFQPVSDGQKALVRQKLGLESHKRYIIFAGSAIQRKGIDVLIDSFIALRQKMNDVEVLIVGPNQFNQRSHYNSPDLQRFVNECKDKLTAAHYDHLVHWIGEVNIFDLPNYMQAADVFCLPTRREGFGLVIIEAMASGLPTVVACLDGITTDIISSDDVGIIIASYLYQDYAEAITTLLTHPEKAAQMGRSARQRALSEFSLDSVVEKWLALFNDLSLVEGRKI